MFVSDGRGEVKGIAALLEHGQRGWHILQKPQVSPWFHLTLVISEEGYETRSALFIDSLATLIPWMKSQADQEGCWVESLQLVSPAWLNGGQGWEMSDLVELAQSQLQAAARLTLRDGRVFYYPDRTQPVEGGYSTVIYRFG